MEAATRLECFLDFTRYLFVVLLSCHVWLCAWSREDVSKAVTKMDRKHVEHAVTAIRKRLDKHFHASADVAVSNYIHSYGYVNDQMNGIYCIQLMCNYY